MKSLHSRYLFYLGVLKHISLVCLGKTIFFLDIVSRLCKYWFHIHSFTTFIINNLTNEILKIFLCLNEGFYSLIFSLKQRTFKWLGSVNVKRLLKICKFKIWLRKPKIVFKGEEVYVQTFPRKPVKHSGIENGKNPLFCLLYSKIVNVKFLSQRAKDMSFLIF